MMKVHCYKFCKDDFTYDEDKLIQQLFKNNKKKMILFLKPLLIQKFSRLF